MLMNFSNTHQKIIRAILCVNLFSIVFAHVASSQAPTALDSRPLPGTDPRILGEISVDEKLGGQFPMDAQFTNEKGEQVRVRDVLDAGRPTVLSLVYHECPMLCNQVLNGMLNVLNEQPWTAGTEYNALTISFDPRDTPEESKDKKGRLLGKYTRAVGEGAWDFLVGKKAEIDRVTQSVGFKYRWDPSQEQFGHAGVLIFLTPEGKVARYLHGTTHNADDVRLALLEASEGRMITTGEKIMAFCYRYDPKNNTYQSIVWMIMRGGGAISAIVFVFALYRFWKKELKATPGQDSSIPSVLTQVKS